MSGGAWKRLNRAARRVLHLLTKPVRARVGRGGLVVQPYRGYGTQTQVFLIGRVFRQPEWGSGVRAGTLRRDLIDLLRRFIRWGVRGVVIEARFYGASKTVQTDRDGYFRIQLQLEQPPPGEQPWHPMELRLMARNGVELEAKGEVFIAPPASEFAVISDIDDTVMYTGVANKLKMFWRLFARTAEDRTAFPGVAAFYQALHKGASGHSENPMLYVSRAPWSIYEVLSEFFNMHGIPVGPILFLREWGMSPGSPLPRRAKDHKLGIIRHMMDLLGELPVVLIGDSGQRDATIYAQIAREFPGRVRAVYIRNVSGSDATESAMEAVAEIIGRSGSSLLLAADTFIMAQHASRSGLIAPDALQAVLRERRREEAPEDREARRAHPPQSGED